jgi:hypothetical protein
MTEISGNFFPSEYKQFPFKEGDLLASQHTDGSYSIDKILKIDKITLNKGESINIMGQRFTAPDEDYLLVISTTMGEYEFETLEQTMHAAKNGQWTIKIGHVPIRAPGAASGKTLIGFDQVRETDLIGYQQWKTAFDMGEAGIF